MENPQSRAVRDIVYNTLAQEGRAPSIAEIARLTGNSEGDIHKHLRTLADDHALVLNSDGDAIRMAHPFSAAPMAFVLTPVDGHDDRRWWGGCAWDSFGIGAAVGVEVRIDTACPQCGAHLSYIAGPETAPPAGLAVRFPRPAAEWWNDVVDTCTNIRMFCNVEHATQWSSGHAPDQGYIAPATSVWKLAQDWYGDRIDRDFQPHSREFNQQLLEDCGLTGEFWRLP